MEPDVVETMLEWMRSHYFGKYRGVVTDSADPNLRGRIKVRVPAVLGDAEVWALPCVPYAGDKVGFFFLPEPGTAVWVEFEGGDPSYPIWTGCFWADGQVPDDGKPERKVLRTGKITRGVIGSRAITLADVAAAPLNIRAAPNVPLEVRFRLGPNYRNPTTYQSSFGVQRDLGGGVSLDREVTLPADCMAFELERLRLTPTAIGEYRLELELSPDDGEAIVNVYVIQVS